MNVKKMLTMVDELIPNQFTDARKLYWLNEIEYTVWVEIIMTHEDPDDTSFGPHPDPAGTDRLLAPEPFDRLYFYYIAAQIAYHNHEVMKYDAASQAFNEAYTQYRNWYNKTHMPRGKVDHLHIVDRTWEVS